MIVAIIPSGIASASVVADGKAIGAIAQVTAESAYEHLSGEKRIGARWLPEGLPADLMGPTTKQEAALLLIALEGLDPAAAVKSLGLAA